MRHKTFGPKRPIETFDAIEFGMIRGSGMLWEMYPEAPMVWSEEDHIPCECTGSNLGVCKGDCTKCIFPKKSKDLLN